MPIKSGFRLSNIEICFFHWINCLYKCNKSTYKGSLSNEIFTSLFWFGLVIYQSNTHSLNTMDKILQMTFSIMFSLITAIVFDWISIKWVRQVNLALCQFWFRWYGDVSAVPSFNTLRLRRTRRHFEDDNFKYIFLNNYVWILNKISLKFIPTGQINNVPELDPIIARQQPGDRPLMLSLIFAWINAWVNNREAGFLRRNRVHFDVIVMLLIVLYFFVANSIVGTGNTDNLFNGIFYGLIHLFVHSLQWLF